MKRWRFVLLITVLTLSIKSVSGNPKYSDTVTIDYFGKSYTIQLDKDIIRTSIRKITAEDTKYVDSLHHYLKTSTKQISQIKESLSLPDWLVYQLVRRLAEQIYSKYDNYMYYTVLKWALLSESGYDPIVFRSKNKILLYIQSPDIIYNLPIKTIGNKQYVCLNYHDYGHEIQFDSEQFSQQFNFSKKEVMEFHYTMKSLPSFQSESYIEKNIFFTYKNQKQEYSVLINSEIQDYFTNYPVTEYRYQFNIPFSDITYNSLIPKLKAKLKKSSIEKGVEYLMVFVRDGFQFETDTKLFGREKRLSAEETLAYNSSDCEDRSALFFLLVKEIYNVPMAIVSYPEHVNVAVLLPKKNGKQILVDNLSLTICEPTPQKKKRGIGWMPRVIRKQPYEIAYFYKQK
jgi:hypothetical protein